MKYIFRDEVIEQPTVMTTSGVYYTLGGGNNISYKIMDYGVKLVLNKEFHISKTELVDVIDFLQGINDYLDSK